MTDYPNIRSIFPDITPEQIRGIIWAVSEDLRPAVNIPELGGILKVVADITGVSEGDMKGTNRSKYICDARKFYCIISRETTKFSYAEIGRQINKEHGTVINCCRKAKDHSINEVEFAFTLGLCRERVNKIVNKFAK